MKIDELRRHIDVMSALDLDGNHLALDFVNTVDWRGLLRDDDEMLNSLADLYAWAHHAGITDIEGARRAWREACRMEDRDPGTAARALGEAIACREAILASSGAISDDSAASDRDLADLSTYLSRTRAWVAVRRGSDGYVVRYEPPEEPPEEPLGGPIPGPAAGVEGQSFDRLLWPLGPVCDAAVDLLLNGELSRVRRCANDECGWLFLDTSKNGKRRWCSMTACGNREKARRHYRRASSSSRISRPSDADR